MEFSRQGYWSELLLPSPDDLPDPGIKPMSLVPPAGEFFTPALPGKPSTYLCYVTEILFPSWKKSDLLKITMYIMSGQGENDN